MKRLFDILAAGTALVLLAPVFLFLAMAILLESKGGVFYRQQRVGKGQKKFWLYKFRSMRPASDRQGLLTVGARDSRITRVGYFIRKYKLDELPQLFNILKGEMSVVGPRPEVPKYVALYDEVQQKVLDVRPGLTDLASLQYFQEAELLAQSANPEKTYIEDILPAKLKLNLEYIERRSFWLDLQIIGKTLLKIFH